MKKLIAKEKLVKAFTRDLSLTVIQWWTEIQREGYERALGAGYSDNPTVSNFGSVDFFYLERDLKAIEKAFFEKISEENDFYLKRRKSYRAAVEKLRELSEETEENKAQELIRKNFFLLQNFLGELYPMYRFAIFIPSVWKEMLEKSLGKKASETISAAFEDRVFSEGALEELDAVFRKLCARNLNKIGKPASLAKILSAEEALSLAAGKDGRLIDWKQVEERKKGFVYCRGKVFADADASEIFSQNGYSFEEAKPEGSFLKGSTAYAKGIVAGRVRKIFVASQAHEFKQGEILVMPMTGPDFVAVMKKAAAIVTDEGGVTCHAAIVSRELKIPCVVGTRLATKMFSDGELVEVDTATGTVRKT